MSEDDKVRILRKVIDFVAEGTALSAREIGPQTRLLEDLSLDGDDFFELMERFAERFEVDLGGYRWYHHHGSEGFNPLHLVFRPWWLEVEHIPVTVALLAEAAARGSWPIDYGRSPVEPAAG